MATYQYETIKVDMHDKVAHVQLNRPKKLNAFNPTMVTDVYKVFTDLARDADVHVVIISGSGRAFTAGLDLSETKMTSADAEDDLDCARMTYRSRDFLGEFQRAFSAIEQLDKPVIAAIHNACIGAGVDLTTAADMRYCTKDAYFSVKEVDVGLAADVGSLQRLPKVIGNQSLVRELCFTGRNLYADEALQQGLVSRVYDTHEQLLAETFKIAHSIAAKSPVAVVGTKHNLIYSRDHSVPESLNYQLTWSSAMLNTEDIPKSFQAFVTKKPAQFSKL
ncbi:ClpP/crotonase-like domain-containing protein [Gongronella butleri]|nr:ClpP/crotonase-like domain-containing protein [Gongronella butleri]